MLTALVLQNSHLTPRSLPSLHEKSKPPFVSSSLASFPSTQSLREPSPSLRFVSLSYLSFFTALKLIVFLLATSTRVRVRSKFVLVSHLSYILRHDVARWSCVEWRLLPLPTSCHSSLTGLYFIGVFCLRYLSIYSFIHSTYLRVNSLTASKSGVCLRVKLRCIWSTKSSGGGVKLYKATRRQMSEILQQA